MKKFFTYLVVTACLMITACQKDSSTDSDSNNSAGYVKGKNRFVITVDGTEREYYVHVPNIYTGNTAVPIVFMLHGTSGNGEEFYDRSGWKEVADTANFIAVFPSSMRYCIIDPQDGQKTTTKWNTTPDAEWVFCTGQNPRDDIKFLRTVIAELETKFKVDGKRIFLAGFSNGGQMAAKCAVSLSDKLAAVVESAGSFAIDTTYTPLRKLPVLFQRGNEDYGPGNTGPALPMSRMNELISVSNGTAWYRTSQAHIRNFSLNTSFVISGDTTKISFADYTGISGNPFKMAMIKGLAHAYPNGTNHPMHAATVNWQWFRQYSLP